MSLEVQEREARGLAERQGWTVAEVYTDHGISGFKDVTRPAHEKMLRDVGPGEAVIVYKLDRLARSSQEFIRFTEHLTERGAVFASVNDPVDTSTATGRAMLTVLAAFAQLESEQTALRLRDTNERRAEQGIPGAGGVRPFGYEPDKRTVRSVLRRSCP